MILESERYDLWIDKTNNIRVYDKTIKMFILSVDSMQLVLEYLGVNQLIFNRIICDEKE